MINSVLIANRGEIAIRIATTLRRLGIEAIGVYAGAAEEGAVHLRAMDGRERLPGGAGREAYLDIEGVIAAAISSGADAIHPGYGFLSENADAAAAVEAAGLSWIGPPPEAMAKLGDKSRAREIARQAGVPVPPGLPDGGGAHTDGGDGRGADGAEPLSAESVRTLAAENGYPIMIKAAAGGGGKGMRRIEEESEIEPALAAARREAESAFGSGALLAEKLIEPARHIEIQVAVDADGEAISLGERECSLQRRHQKLIEEAPSPAVDEELRERLGRAATDLAKESGYRGLGTVEFLVDHEDPARFYFLEVNARLQVEHPVTELVTGLDLVAMQVAIARGESVGAFIDGESATAAALIKAPGDRPPFPLPGRHAIEARVCAERPAEDFFPATGRVEAYAEPVGARFTVPEGEPDSDGAVRVDSGVALGVEVTSEFDPMLAKLIAVGPDRATAIERLREALVDFRLLGVETNADFLRRLLARDAVGDGSYSLAEVERYTDSGGYGDDLAAAEPRLLEVAAAALCVGKPASEDRPGAGATGFDRADGWRPGEPGWGRWTLTSADGTAHELRARPLAGGTHTPSGGHGDEAGRARSVTDGPGFEIAVDDSAPQTVTAIDRGIGGQGEIELDLGRDSKRERWAYLLEWDRVWIQGPGGAAVFSRARHGGAVTEQAAGSLEAKLPGVVLAVAVEAGDRVEAGQHLVTVESMKMEMTIEAPTAGVVAELSVAVGDHVRRGQTIATVEAPDERP